MAIMEDIVAMAWAARADDRLSDGELYGKLAAEIERLRAALIEIRDHWANQYDHPRKESAMYAGPYGIGVTDGHRAAAIIAARALAPREGG